MAPTYLFQVPVPGRHDRGAGEGQPRPQGGTQQVGEHQEIYFYWKKKGLNKEKWKDK